ncbi:MAG: hypothetical protein IJU76_07120 [Desulfovibrionaceae bacterium]|nr:hypothetical protein [Desulfovibrionaceae bacterium]
MPENDQSIFNRIIYNNFSIIFVWFLATQSNALRFPSKIYLYLDVRRGVLSIERYFEEETEKILIDEFENTPEQRRKIAGADFDSFYRELIEKIKVEYANSLPLLHQAYTQIDVKNQQYIKNLPYCSVYWNF